MSRLNAYIIRSSCKGCHDCIGVCPSDAISFIDGGAIIDQDRCTDCGSCITVCRFNAILH